MERPCSHAATPSGPYSYVLDVWGSLSPAPGPHQLRHWAATPDAAPRPHCDQSMEAPRTFVPFNDYGKALNRSASPQRYPRPTKPLAARPRRLSFGAAERAPTTTGAPPPESPTMSTEPTTRAQPDHVHGAAALGLSAGPRRRRLAAGEPTPPTRQLSASPTRPARRVAVRDIGASCHDGRHPATAMFDGQKFWATTGLFPQSALARLPSPTRLSSLSLDVGPSVRQVTVSVGHDDFEDVATVTFEGGGNKRVSLENVLARDVRIRIDLCSGRSPSSSPSRSSACPPNIVNLVALDGNVPQARPSQDRPDLRVVRPPRSRSRRLREDAPAGAVHGGLEGVGQRVPPFQRSHLQI